MRRTILVSLVVATAGMLACAGLSGAHTKQSTTTFDPDPPNALDLGPGQAEFFGNLSSPTGPCMRDRKVTVFDGPDVVGSDRTDDDGYWSVVSSDGTVEYGEPYFAAVNKTVVRRNSRHKHICKGARSQNMIVTSTP